MATPRLNFFKLTVADAEVSAEFYTATMGMGRGDTIDTPGFKEIMLTSGTSPFTLVLFEWKDGRAIEHGNGYGPVGFLTRDVEATMAAMEAAGAKPRGPVQSFGPMRIVFVKTPDGHEIELMQHAA